MATVETLEQTLQRFIENTAQRFQRSEESAARVDKALAELSEQSQKMQQELVVLAKRSDERFERVEHSMAQARLELQALAKQTQTELSSLSQQVKQTTKQMGELSLKMGTLVEDLVSPDMLRILRQVAGLPDEAVGTINVHVQRRYRGVPQAGYPLVIELDAVAECGDYVLINETKASFRPEYVTAFVERLGQVRAYFPEFEGKQIMGAIASLRLDGSLMTHTTRQGLFVLALGEGMLRLHNEPGFQPKIF